MSLTRGYVSSGGSGSGVDVSDTLLVWRFLFPIVDFAAGQNYLVLDVSLNQGPTEPAAVNAGSALGAVVATLPGPTGSHSLLEVAGRDEITPKNLCWIRNATTFGAIISDGRRVFGLLQAAFGTQDGDAFNDTDRRVQLSFVRLTVAGDDLEAVPPADIAAGSFNYAYQRRELFGEVEEQDLLFSYFASPDETGVPDQLLSNEGTLVYINDGELVTI